MKKPPTISMANVFASIIYGNLLLITPTPGCYGDDPTSWTYLHMELLNWIAATTYQYQI